MHAMRQNVRDTRPIGLFSGWIVEVIGPRFVPSLLVGNSTSDLTQPSSSHVESSSQTSERLVLVPLEFYARHQGRPNFHVVNYVIQRRSQSPMTDIVRTVQLLIVERFAALEQLTSGPAIVLQQAIREIHSVHLMTRRFLCGSVTLRDIPPGADAARLLSVAPLGNAVNYFAVRPKQLIRNQKA